MFSVSLYVTCLECFFSVTLTDIVRNNKYVLGLLLGEHSGHNVISNVAGTSGIVLCGTSMSPFLYALIAPWPFISKGGAEGQAEWQASNGVNLAVTLEMLTVLKLACCFGVYHPQRSAKTSIDKLLNTNARAALSFRTVC